jgi:hypothetical protein
MSPHSAHAVSTIERIALALVMLAAVAMLSFPAARGVSESFGWLPLWLLGLPLSAWVAARWRRWHAPAEATWPQARVYRLAAARDARMKRTAMPQALRRAA